MKTKQVFKELCDATIGDAITSFGFQFHAVNTRPRGVVIKYIKDEKSFYLTCEGNVLHAEIIEKTSENTWRRISLNQFLWYSGMRDLVSVSGCDQQLKILSSELTKACSQFFNGAAIVVDSRYCYIMTALEYELYLEAQK